MRFILPFLALIMLSACADAPKPRGKPVPDLRYSHLEKLTVNGAGGLITRTYLQNTSRGDLGHQLAIPLPSLIERYLNGRFMSVSAEGGRTPAFEIDIRTLGVTREMTSEGTFGGLLGGDELITANVVLVFTPLISGTLDKIYTLTVQRRLMINGNMSLADRELAEVELLEALIGDIDQKILSLFTPEMR